MQLSGIDEEDDDEDGGDSKVNIDDSQTEIIPTIESSNEINENWQNLDEQEHSRYTL